MRAKPQTAAPVRVLLSAGTALMLCVPHEFWSNMYGVAFALSVSAVYFLGGGRCGRVFRGPIGAAWCVFTLTCALCPLWSASPAGSLRTAVFYLAGGCLAFVSANVFHSAEDADVLLRGVTLALLFTALYGLIRRALGADLYGVPIGDRVLPRLGSTLEHAINYGEFAAMALPLAFSRALRQDTRARRTLALSFLALPLTALALTYARTGWLALGAAAALGLYACGNNAVRLAALPLVLLPALPGTVRARLFSVLDWSDRAASGRFTLWRECLAALRANLPLGVGLGTENFARAYLPFSSGTLPFSPPHSNMGYLEMFLSLGIPGGTAFLVFFFGIFVRLRRRLRQARGADMALTVSVTASLAGAAAANIPEHLWFYPRIWFFWCMLYGLALGLTSKEMPSRTPDRELSPVSLRKSPPARRPQDDTLSPCRPGTHGPADAAVQ